MMPSLPGVPRYPTPATSSLSRSPTQVLRGSPSSRAHSVPCLDLHAPSGANDTLGEPWGGRQVGYPCFGVRFRKSVGLGFWRRANARPAASCFVSFLTLDRGLPSMRVRRGALRVRGRLARLLANQRSGPPEGKPHRPDTTERPLQRLGPVRGISHPRTGPSFLECRCRRRSNSRSGGARCMNRAGRLVNLINQAVA